jgi:hypothetical protein
MYVLGAMFDSNGNRLNLLNGSKDVSIIDPNAASGAAIRPLEVAPSVNPFSLFYTNLHK